MPLLTHWDGEPVAVWTRVWKAAAVEAHDVLGSTNDRLRELAAGGAAPWTVVVAEAQTRGRGRGGAVWHSPAGAGLWLSVLLPCEEPVPASLPLAVGVAAARAAEEVAPGVLVGIKWPNDLEVAGRKIGGILCEHGHGWVVVGIGLNVLTPEAGIPAEVAARATSLEASSGGRVSVGALATALLHQLRASRWGGGPGLDGALHRELADRDVLRGKGVWTSQAGPGTARGIAGDGALLLELPGGKEARVVSGSIRIAKEA